MRAYRIILIGLCAVAVGCKTVQTTTATPTVSAYSEDLSKLRPVLEEPVQTEVRNEAVVPAGHIKKEIDSVASMIIAKNSKPRVEQGFTIQIYNGSSREEAIKALGNFRIKFEEVEADMIYFQPDFRVKAGKFLDRVVAYETFEKVKVEFPGALLIPEKIKINYD